MAREPLDGAEIEAARRVDPTGFLEGLGYTVRREGRHLSVRLGGHEHFRITRKPDGHWVACDKHSQGIGDNVDLVRRIDPRAGFREAVQRLTGTGPVGQEQPDAWQPRPTLPPEAGPDRDAGRAYLKRRGIGLETIRAAEQVGFLRYVQGAVLFVGRDAAGQVRNVSRRAVDRAEEVQKRDFRGSDKRYPPILPGNPASVWIVEGGTDALALHELARRSGQQPPTVLVSGGANVRAFLDMPVIQALLRRAGQVTIARDRESDPVKQAETDAAHDQQRERVQEITGRTVRDWRPPVGVKDLAEYNEREAARQRGMTR